jgi:hypothetical protein
VTTWWAAFTQWFFGPPIIDRGFRLTGGVCGDLEKGRDTGMGDAAEVVTSAACKLAGGQWRGGHDISGHVLLLTLGCAFLGLEILPVLVRYAGLREERVVKGRDCSVVHAGRLDAAPEGDGQDGKKGVGAPLVVAGLSWWMLFMTAAYFHTWVEKVCCTFRSLQTSTQKRMMQTTNSKPIQFSGLLVAFVGIGIVYFLPRVLPALREIIGMPGCDS